MIIDGRGIAQKILGEVKAGVARLPFVPVFCDVLVGRDPASVQYVNMKAKAAENTGMRFRRAEYAPDISDNELAVEIKKIGAEKYMCGLIVQLPLPAHIDPQPVLDAIDPRIDVDCTGRDNSEKFYAARPRFVYPTAAAVLAVLDSLPADYSDKRFLIIGQGQLVGGPVAQLLKMRGLNVRTADSSTGDIKALLKGADVVIAAAGRPRLIVGADLKLGSIVIDAGTSESGGGIVGDVDTDLAVNTASYLAAVPGGVGPVTVAQLLRNVLLAAQMQASYGTKI